MIGSSINNFFSNIIIVIIQCVILNKNSVPKVLFKTCVAMKFVDDDDDDVYITLFCKDITLARLIYSLQHVQCRLQSTLDVQYANVNLTKHLVLSITLFRSPVSMTFKSPISPQYA